MKNTIFTLIIIVIIAVPVISQVSIGTNQPHKSTILQLESTNKGFLPPRMTEQQKNAISNPPNGLIIFDITSNSLQYFDSTHHQWISVNSNSPTDNPISTDFLVVSAIPTIAYGYAVNSNGVGAWSSVALNGASPILLEKNKSSILIHSPNTLAVFYKNASGNGTWSTQSISAGPPGKLLTGNNTFVRFTPTEAFAFYQNSSGNGVWLKQVLATYSAYSGEIGKNDVAMFQTNSGVYIFYLDANNVGHWAHQPLTALSTGGLKD